MTGTWPGTPRRWRALVASLLRGRRSVGKRFVLTTVDQGVASLSNFAVGVAVARIAGIDALGAYALAYVIWLVLADVHRSLVTDPMAIENDCKGDDVSRNIRLGMASELFLGVTLGTAVAMVGAALWLGGARLYGTAFLALAPCLPFLLLQDFWRWVAFMRARPGQALANDLVFDALQAGAFVALFTLGIRNSVLAIAAWGIGALAGAAFGLAQHSVRPAFGAGLARIGQRWQMSRWILAGAVTNWGGSNLYVVLTGVFLGPAAIGGLRAAVSLVNGPSLVLVQAGGSVGLPEAAKALDDRGWPGLRRVHRVVTAAGMAGVGAIGLVVLLFGRQLLVALYGPGFGRFAGAADLLAVSVFLGTMSLGAGLSLKATRQTQMLFGESILTLLASVAAVIVLAPLYGVVGAAASTLVKATTSSTVFLSLHWRHSRRGAERRFDQLAAERASSGVPANGAVPAVERVPGGAVPAVQLAPSGAAPAGDVAPKPHR